MSFKDVFKKIRWKRIAAGASLSMLTITITGLLGTIGLRLQNYLLATHYIIATLAYWSGMYFFDIYTEKIGEADNK